MDLFNQSRSCVRPAVRLAGERAGEGGRGGGGVKAEHYTQTLQPDVSYLPCLY